MRKKLVTLFSLLIILVLSVSPNVYAYDIDFKSFAFDEYLNNNDDTEASDKDWAKALTGTNKDTGYEYILNDSADFIDASSEKKLVSKLKNITNYCNVAIVTTTYHTYGSTETFAVKTLENYFGMASNSVIFVIDRHLNEIYLCSEGNARNILSNSKCNSICDNTYIYATSKHNYDYYTCSIKTIDQVNIVLSGGHISQPLKYISSMFISFAVGMIICFIYVFSLSRLHTADFEELIYAITSKVDVKNAHQVYV